MIGVDITEGYLSTFGKSNVEASSTLDPTISAVLDFGFMKLRTDDDDHGR